MVDSNQIGTWRQELLGYLVDMGSFHNQPEHVDILSKISAMSARASYMRARVVIVHTDECKRFRLDEIDPFLKEVDRQFKDWSRIIAVVSQEWHNS